MRELGPHIIPFKGLWGGGGGYLIPFSQAVSIAEDVLSRKGSSLFTALGLECPHSPWELRAVGLGFRV